MSLVMKLDMVNKYEYEKCENYRKIIVRIPIESEKLVKDLNYLGLSDDNLSIQNAKVLKCEVIDEVDLDFSATISTKITNIMNKASEKGYTTSFQDVYKMFQIVKSLDNDGRNKLLAVLEIKKEQIFNMEKAVKYAKKLDYFEFFNNVNTYEDYAKELIDEKEISFEEMSDFVDMEALGETYVDSGKGIFTNQGLIFEVADVEENQKYTVQIEEEEYEI